MAQEWNVRAEVATRCRIGIFDLETGAVPSWSLAEHRHVDLSPVDAWLHLNLFCFRPVRNRVHLIFLLKNPNVKLFLNF